MSAHLLTTGVATTVAGPGWQAGGSASIFGWTLVHSLWQAGLVACALGLVLRFVPGVMPRLRTAVASGGLVLVAGLAVGTWGGLAADWRQHQACWQSDIYADAHAGLCASHGVTLPGDAVVEGAGKPRAVLPWAGPLTAGMRAPALRRAALALTNSRTLSLIGLLFGGVAAGAFLRLLADLYLLRRLIRRSWPLEDAHVRRRLDGLRERMGVRRSVEVRESGDVGTPAVAGWRRPVILLPEGMTGTLEPQELDGVLSHELVHVRRRHFALNLAQRALECLFAWNPFVLWISGRVREEREALCDAAAAGPPEALADRRRYAETLLRLERLRTPARVTSIGLLGEGSLLRRVRRLTESTPAGPFVRMRRIGSAALTVAATLLVVGPVSVYSTAISSYAVMERDISVREQMTAPHEMGPVGETIPDDASGVEAARSDGRTDGGT
ncbi:MAG: M56 family metallopeptidase [Gemmatimonadota bacterium]